MVCSVAISASFYDGIYWRRILIVFINFCGRIKRIFMTTNGCTRLRLDCIFLNLIKVKVIKFMECMSHFKESSFLFLNSKSSRLHPAQNWNSNQYFYLLSDWVEILWGVTKFCFKQMLKVSAFYLEKQQSSIDPIFSDSFEIVFNKFQKLPLIHIVSGLHLWVLWTLK
jgi:hypothetical protein